MKQTDLSRRAFLLGLGAVSSAALLSACNTNAPVNSGPTPSQPESEPAASPDASSEVTREPILTADEFPMTDGSTACIPLIAQIMADTTGMDLETAQSCVSTNTTAWAWRNLSLYGGNEGDSTKLIIAYEAPESVKEELKADTKATRSVASVDRLIARADKQIQLREREMASMRVENAEPVSEAEYETAEAVLKAVVGIERGVKSRTNGRRRCTVWEP